MFAITVENAPGGEVFRADPLVHAAADAVKEWPSGDLYGGYLKR